ncbi:MAG TPA: ROK family protein [Chthoniobacterales bacterium]|nr:ROK family protein [Chthoniobacterales bacterium]
MKKKKVLVIDVGGSHVKLLISRNGKRRKFDSGENLQPRKMVAEIKKAVGDWKFDVIAIGFPAPVSNGKILQDPKNLGKGWVRFDFRKALGKPVRIMNDAAMQALGSYHGGRMLFLGLGTGLGSALLWDRTVLSLELGDLPYLDNLSVEDWVGGDGLEKFGEKRWQAEVRRVVSELKKSFIANYVVLGGGNAKLAQRLPAGVALGHNRNAYTGGARLWQSGKGSKPTWTII